jgi:hypothetical protein
VTLRVVPVVLTPPAQTFQVAVPGNERWTVNSVCAQVHRAVGGLPNRGYTLLVMAAGIVLGAVGAPDLGTEPGSAIVTWADAPSVAVTFVNDTFVVAPFASIPLDPGYQLFGQIVNPAGADAFTAVNVWVDYVPQ